MCTSWALGACVAGASCAAGAEFEAANLGARSGATNIAGQADLTETTEPNVSSQTNFLARAAGSVRDRGADDDFDKWQIDQTKTLSNVRSGI